MYSSILTTATSTTSSTASTRDNMNSLSNRSCWFGSDAELLDCTAKMSFGRFQEEARRHFKLFFEKGDVETCLFGIKDLASTTYDDELFVIAVLKALDSPNVLAPTHLRIFIKTYYFPDEAMVNAKQWDCSYATDDPFAATTWDGCLYSSRGNSYLRGVVKLLSIWESLSLDVPHAPQFLIGLVFWSIENNYLYPEIAYEIPEKLLKALPEGKYRDELEEVLDQLPEFKSAVRSTLAEFLLRANEPQEVKYRLEKLQMSRFHHEFVRLALLEGVRQNVDSSKDVEQVALLLDYLRENLVLEEGNISAGVLLFLGSGEGVLLDCPKFKPKASELFGWLLDLDLIRPSFVRRCLLLRIGGAVGRDVLMQVVKDFPNYLRSTARGAEFKHELRQLILEFIDSGDSAEAKRIFRELSMDSEQKAEFVRKVVFFGLERSVDAGKQAMRLLSSLLLSGELTENDVSAGFYEFDGMTDVYELDLPHTGELFSALCEQFQLQTGHLRHNKVWARPQLYFSEEAEMDKAYAA